MVRKLILIAALLLTATVLHAQYAPSYEEDAQALNSRDGQKFIKAGHDRLVFGGITALVGGAVAAVPLIVDHYREPTPPDEFKEDMATPILLIFGISTAVVGVGTMLDGIVHWACGNWLIKSEDYWKNLRYDDPGQSGYGFNLDVAGFIPWLELRASAGYHFNKSFYLGGGLGSIMNFAAIEGGGTFVNLPVFTEMRYSMLNRFFSPYIGLAAGWDFLDRFVYLGGDLGLRIRPSTTSHRSLWIAATVEIGGSYFFPGLKMGWSF